MVVEVVGVAHVLVDQDHVLVHVLVHLLVVAQSQVAQNLLAQSHQVAHLVKVGQAHHVLVEVHRHHPGRQGFHLLALLSKQLLYLRPAHL